VPEPHQPGAALRLLDQRAELLIGVTCLKVAEQRPDVRPADAAEDPIQHAGEWPFAFDDVPTNRHLKHMLGGDGLPFLSPAWAVPLRDHAEPTALWSLPMRQTQELHQMTLPPQATPRPQHPLRRCGRTGKITLSCLARRRLSALTQLPSVPSLMPRSRATCTIGLPVSRTSRTAPSLKS
jgi:hypothetical protein